MPALAKSIRPPENRKNWFLIPKLSDLGKTVGYEKITLSEEVKSHMDKLLAHDPVTFFEYVSTDSVVIGEPFGIS